MPIYDVTQLLGKAGDDGGNVESLIHQTGKQVFSEYLLLEQLPRDVADAHLSGDIHITNAGSWGLTPDTVFVDLLSVRSGGLNPRGRIVNTSMIPSPENAERALNIVLNMASMLCRETSDEVTFRNFLQYVGPFCKSRGKREIETLFLRFYEAVSSPLAGSQAPAISIELNPYRHDDVGREVLDRTLDAALGAYRSFVAETPRPDVRLLLAKPNRVDETKTLKDAAAIIYNGGRIAFFSSDQRRSFLGLDANILAQESQADNVSVLHGLSLNLPRLAFDSNQDETYFRAKLALLISVAADALSTRRRLVERSLKRGLLPSLASGSDAVTSDTMPLIMNLVGLDETLASLIRDPTTASRYELAEKIVETATQVAVDKSTRIDRLGVAMLDLDGAARLANLDAEKYGKANLQPLQKGAYSQAPKLVLADLENPEKVAYMAKLSGGLHGGLSVTLDGAAEEVRGIYNLILNATPKIPYFKVDRIISVCRNCGAKLPQNATRCARCKSVATTQYSTAV
jgi:ribonucleoside-triphosphate reductase (formate)